LGAAVATAVQPAVAVMAHKTTASIAAQRTRSRVDRPFTSTPFAHRYTIIGHVISEQ